MAADSRYPESRSETVIVEATGVVAYFPPDPLAKVAEWSVRVTYPLHPPRCGLGPLGDLGNGRLPR